ncbi:hypothetical protein [Alkalimonas mucilaginosa]|uniref:PH domain-containing protein n=1 Tax=Alkalimonas mucilaginosa TaxID=3057676 RepID=A0ABU7JDF5_9GAMM|nr:hypothetical protein [Alkalimonas sp. MEB004]MEE2023731.1 hypothetical protein [Alkalimonas sp. MEB004]
MKIWRNGKTEKISLFKSIFLHIWLVPAVPLGVYAFAFYIDARGNRWGAEKEYFLLSILNIEQSFTVLFLSGVGCLLWLLTIKALTMPVFVLSKEKLTLYSYGFFPDHLALASLAEIRPYNLGPIGTLIDFKSNVGTNFREFAFLAKINKDVLQELVGEHSVKVV